MGPNGKLPPVGKRLIRPPVGAENLCDQAILVNQAAGAVTALDPEPVQVGDAVG